MIRNGILALTTFLCAPAVAQTAPCTDAEYRQFDFWLGEWDVYDFNGTFMEQNSIEKSADGCMIHESTQTSGGNVEQSYSYYKPSTGQWTQFSVGSNAVIEYSGRLNAEGAMALNGYIYHRDERGTRPFKGLWTPQDDGTIVQEFWEKPSQGGDWDIWFNGTAVRPDAG